MDITGKHLDDALIRGWLRLFMAVGVDYTLPTLVERVTAAHETAGGLAPTLPAEMQERRFRAALNELVTEGWVAYSAGLVQEGETLVQEMWANDVEPSEEEDLPTIEAKTGHAERMAEVMIGEGSEAVYGWYLPAYRELAALRGESRWPMKVGMTTVKPYERIREHVGTAPEKPVLGFVWQVGEAAYYLEQWLHSQLRRRKQHLPHALGQEWFLTTPYELREIVYGLAHSIMKEDTNESERPRQSLSDGDIPAPTVRRLSDRRRRPQVV